MFIPRGRQIKTYTPTGLNGATFQTKYGVAGLTRPSYKKGFIAEGLNEAGLRGPFLFPPERNLPAYDLTENNRTVNTPTGAVLALFSSVDEAKTAPSFHPDYRSDKPDSTSTVHWHISDLQRQTGSTGNCRRYPHFYDNPVGILTTPGFGWQLTNRNNYINLFSGGVAPTP